LSIAFTWPEGLTVTVKELVPPTQARPAFVMLGVTSIVLVMGAPVVLEAVKAIVPEPVPAKPIPVLLFVQL
jgi:hypothetical protein